MQLEADRKEAKGSPALKSSRLLGLARLARPPNIITAYADIFAGYAASSGANPAALPFLLLATTGLYGGGVVFNDVFDAQLDATERPSGPYRAELFPSQPRLFLARCFWEGAFSLRGDGRPSAALWPLLRQPRRCSTTELASITRCWDQ